MKSLKWVWVKPNVPIVSNHLYPHAGQESKAILGTYLEATPNKTTWQLQQKNVAAAIALACGKNGNLAESKIWNAKRANP